MRSEAELRFYYGTMGSGKSTLALQVTYNLKSANKGVVLLTKFSRESGFVSSRLGVTSRAVDVGEDDDLFELVSLHGGIDYLVCDEAQFFSPEQVGQLAAIVDQQGVNVYAFGLLTTFQGVLFDGSKRLVELSDAMVPVDTLDTCTCGRQALMNARFIDGDRVSDGDAVAVGDVGDDARLTYETLCRRCWMRYDG